MLGADDLELARRFYDATFAAISVAPAVIDPKGRLLYRHEGDLFIVGKPIDGKAATHANGGTVGLRAESLAALKAWHEAGLANGGSLCEGQPERRVSPATGGEVWAAYLRDPTGNKLCVVYELPS